jgi:hypothetical protein
MEMEQMMACLLVEIRASHQEIVATMSTNQDKNRHQLKGDHRRHEGEIRLTEKQLRAIQQIWRQIQRK